MPQGRQVQLWWAPGHQGIIGNEQADSATRVALDESKMTLGEHYVARTMLEGAAQWWYQGQIRSQECNTREMLLEPTEEVIIHTDLGWTQAMPSYFMAARVS